MGLICHDVVLNGESGGLPHSAAVACLETRQTLKGPVIKLFFVHTGAFCIFYNCRFSKKRIVGGFVLMENLSKLFRRKEVPKKVYGEGEEIVYSVCPQDCYCTCSTRIHLKDGKVVKIDGLPESPYTRGTLCLKGQAYIQHTFNPQRLKYPMLRQEDGSFKRISWDEAIDIIGEKLAFIKNHFGPSSMIWWPGADPFGMHSSWGNRFFNMYGSVNLISPGDSLMFLSRGKSIRIYLRHR